MGLLKTARQSAATVILRPYIYRELPGWGHLYQTFVGSFESDDEWKGLGRRWMRGKLHGYEMSLDLGYWSNRSTYFLGRFYDLPTQLLLKAVLRQDDTFIDIGANEGMISLLASRLVGDAGRVIAFEPNPKPRFVFQAAIDRNNISNITIHEFGLSDINQTLQMSVPKINVGEGTFGKSNYSSDHIDVIECKVRVGDEVLATTSTRVIKIDVEGFELHVLKGLVKTIMRERPAIVLEMVAGHLRNAGSDVGDLVSFMRDLGYSSFRLGLSGRHSLRLMQGDIPSEVNGDYLWIHPHNRIVDHNDFD